MTESRPVDTEFLAANWKDQDCIHALVIGVGDYQAHEIQTGLTSLSSPPLSAYELGRFILDAPLGSHARPLGSLELLISPFEDDKVMRGWNHEIQRADLGPIQAAFNRWYARCHEREGNLALFYFCGHGYQKDDFVILPSDFGANPNNKWQSAINMTKTLQGMKQCRAKQQVYWFDACRNLNRDLLQERDFGGVSLKAGRYDGARVHEIHELYATAEGFKAFGHAGRLSRFSQALLSALRGSDLPEDCGPQLTAEVVAKASMTGVKRINLGKKYTQTVIRNGHPGDSIIIRNLRQAASPPSVFGFECLAPTITKQLDLINQIRPKREVFGLVSLSEFPHSLGEGYVGRDDLLRSIHATLVKSKRMTLSGFAGIGKTQTVTEYARRYQCKYPGGVFWANAENQIQLTFDLYYALLALHPKAPDLHNIANQRVLRQLLKIKIQERVKQKGAVLWIVDNIPEADPYEEPSPLFDYCPARDSVHLLLTARSNYQGGDSSVVVRTLCKLDVVPAIELLTYNLDPKCFTTIESRALVNWVGCLPLALKILNSGVREGAYSPQELLDLSIQQGAEIPGLESITRVLRGSVAANSLRGVAEAFFVSYQALDADSQDLARLLSLLAHRAIPIELIESLQKAKLINRASRVKLLKRNFLSNGESNCFGTLHRLLREFLRTQVEVEEKHEKQQALAVIFLGLLAPQRCHDPTQSVILEPIVELSLALLNEISNETEHTVLLNLSLGDYLKQRGRSKEAFDIYTRTFLTGLQMYGANHPHTLAAVNNLTMSYHQQCNLSAEALKISQKSISAFKKNRINKALTDLAPDNHTTKVHRERDNYSEVFDSHE